MKNFTIDCNDIKSAFNFFLNINHEKHYFVKKKKNTRVTVTSRIKLTILIKT